MIGSYEEAVAIIEAAERGGDVDRLDEVRAWVAECLRDVEWSARSGTLRSLRARLADLAGSDLGALVRPPPALFAYRILIPAEIHDEVLGALGQHPGVKIARRPREDTHALADGALHGFGGPPSDPPPESLAALLRSNPGRIPPDPGQEAGTDG